ncbi:MAG TPA: hypothetical protein VEW28_07835 [Candidatus Kapabacteria bacterium]|nr:hypothetical protein [Candidatus Kapabacteria bacterium]
MSLPIYRIPSETDVIFPAALEEAFTSFVSASGMPFAPRVSHEGANVRIHFFFVSKPLEELVKEFLATFEPDGFHATELAVPNDRVKHVIRIAEESNWLPFIRQQGADRARICFIRTPRSVTAVELEERIELVS